MECIVTQLKRVLATTFILAVPSFAAQAEPNVVASIKPVHSLVAGVMEGVGKPTLIVEGASSPHTYALKPSQAKTLEGADVVFWIGPEMEAFLEKPIGTVATKAKSVELIDAKGLRKLPYREGGAFEAHDDDHGDHGHDDHKKADAHKDHDHDDHKKAKTHKDHDHDDHKKADAHKDHDHADAHAHGEFDAHVWLDPQNAKALVHEIEHALADADPENASKYKANAEKLEGKLDALTKEVTADLKSFKDKGFVVFHDAYQNFEKRFGVKAVGSITVSPEVIPGAKRVKEIRDKVKSLGATCVFAEPQFEPKLVTTVTQGTKAKSAVLDPLGANLQDGPELYFALIRNMAKAMRDCLSEAS